MFWKTPSHCSEESEQPLNKHSGALCPKMEPRESQNEILDVKASCLLAG